jgi:hypothetical protein
LDDQSVDLGGGVAVGGLFRFPFFQTFFLLFDFELSRKGVLCFDLVLPGWSVGVCVCCWIREKRGEREEDGYPIQLLLFLLLLLLLLHPSSSSSSASSTNTSPPPPLWSSPRY